MAANPATQTAATTAPAAAKPTRRLRRCPPLPPDFILPDPPPMPDAMQQDRAFIDTAAILRAHFSADPTALVSGNTYIAYDPNDLNVRILPDCYAAFGVDPPAVIARNGYILWEVGKPPDFALEIASKSTARRDVSVKPGIYARIGIGEYWRFDATGGDFYGYPLAGDRLVNGVYHPIPTTTDADGLTWGYSAALGLHLCARADRLLFYDPAAGEFLRDMLETMDDLREERIARQIVEDELTVESAARSIAENALGAEQSARRRAEDALTEERAAREIDRNMIRQLQDELRRLREENPNPHADNDDDSEDGKDSAPP